MERRKFILGAGALAAGGAAAIGSGAFSSVSAERTASVNVVSDDSAYVRLNPTDERATIKNNQLELDFTSSSNGADGLNPNSRTEMLNLFEIENQGDNPAYVAVGTQKSDVYADPSGKDGLLFDYENLGGFVYNEEPDGSGTGLPFNGGSGNMEIDSGGRIRFDNDSNGSSDPANNEQILYAGESISVSLSLIVDGTQLGTGKDKIVVGAADPTNQRDTGE